MSSPPTDDRVGYRHPPRKNRWKKGQSGNLKGRRKKSELAITIIDRLLHSSMRITLNGEAIRVTALEAIVLQLFQKALAGDAGAKRALLKYQKFSSQNLERKRELIFVDSDYTQSLGRISGSQNG